MHCNRLQRRDNCQWTTGTRGYPIMPTARSEKRSLSTPNADRTHDATADKRQRILEAALASFMRHGFSDTSTLEIATRAKVSKRELYALVGSKHDMLVACIAGRAARMRWAPADAPDPHDSETLMAVLEAFGTRLLTEVTHPAVVAVFQLAVAEAKRAPEVARALEAQGRDANRAPLRTILVRARESGLLQGDCAEMAEQFMALLWGDLRMASLLRLADTPTPTEIRRRARNAAAALLKLHQR
jgi:AcrR family transcriptional regulator